jgi:L,D-peptidoglycan transpeptidase YkuD (ErfK/YbiS/YcfS/YnhG family)
MLRAEIVVTPDPAQPDRGTLTFAGHVFECVLGRGGVHKEKREGDGATPAGRFALRRVLYRPDRVKVKTALPIVPIHKNDGWCDAPDDPNYNKPVTLPYPAGAEPMWRDDRLYDVVVVLGHNDAPVVPGAGSAIFMHVAPEDGATQGCIALKQADLLSLLTAVDSTAGITVMEQAGVRRR